MSRLRRHGGACWVLLVRMRLMVEHALAKALLAGQNVVGALAVGLDFWLGAPADPIPQATPSIHHVSRENRQISVFHALGFASSGPSPRHWRRPGSAIAS